MAKNNKKTGKRNNKDQKNEGSVVKNIFSSFIKKKDPIFKDKHVLEISYMPDEIIHRDKEIKEIANILGTALRGYVPSNILIYGKTGTGKTITVKYVIKQLEDLSKESNVKLKTLYVNCKLKRVADTEYRLLSHLLEMNNIKMPFTGLPTEEIYKRFFEFIENFDGIVIIVLDEIDHLIEKIGDSVLYTLTRINSELDKSKISIIGISNKTTFVDMLDQRVKSSLSEEEILFAPYDALQIQDILRARAKLAFNPGVVKEGVIEKTAALAATNHGDARKAIELLRIAGELASRENKTELTIDLIDKAEKSSERNSVFEMVKTQPKQFKVVLYSIITLSEIKSKQKSKIYTGESYNVYKEICNKARLRPITQRRYSDIIAELDILGLINAKIMSKGRFGRTREIELSISKDIIKKVKKILEQDILY